MLLTAAVADGATFVPAMALRDAEASRMSTPQTTFESVEPRLHGPARISAQAVEATVEATVEAAPSTASATAEPIVAAPMAAAPAAAPKAAVLVAAAPKAAAPIVQVAVPVATCPADWFCYPRLGVRGPIVPYSDCTGATDVGTSIRSFACLSPNYVMGHAYTQFGKVTQWHAGDVVWANGRSFTVFGAVIGRSCEPALMPLAPLSMQTSLSPNKCGDVLIVQAG